MTTPLHTLLLVDDNRDAVDTLAFLLEQAGYAVVRAYSVREALDLLDERSDIDVVVSDIRMPEVDGFDFLRVLRHRAPTMPIVLMTGAAPDDTEALPRGAVVLTKPFRVPDLEAAIQTQLERISRTGGRA